MSEFRLEEEAKFNREKELLELKLLSARGAFSKNSTESVIRTFCAELLRLWDAFLSSDLSSSAVWIRALVMLVTAVVGIVEIVAAMRELVKKFLSGETSLKLSFIPPKRNVTITIREP